LVVIRHHGEFPRCLFDMLLWHNVVAANILYESPLDTFFCSIGKFSRQRCSKQFWVGQITRFIAQESKLAVERLAIVSRPPLEKEREWDRPINLVAGRKKRVQRTRDFRPWNGGSAAAYQRGLLWVVA
jgi:hypothetical protein